MKKYILRLIILLAFTGAFFIKIVNQLVFALLDRIEVFNDKRVKIHFTFEDVLKSYETG